jgi:hypothetical protein
MKFFIIFFLLLFSSCNSKNEIFDIYIPENISWSLKKSKENFFPKNIEYSNYTTIVNYNGIFYILHSYNMRVDKDSIVFGTEPDIYVYSLSSDSVTFSNNSLLYRRRKFIRSNNYFKRSHSRIKDFL